MDEMRRRGAENGNTRDRNNGNSGSVGLKTAEQLLKEHRQAQGFDLDPATPAPATGGGNGPAGGQVIPNPSVPAIPDPEVDTVQVPSEGTGGLLPRPRPGGRRGGYTSVNV